MGSPGEASVAPVRISAWWRPRAGCGTVSQRTERTSGVKPSTCTSRTMAARASGALQQYADFGQPALREAARVEAAQRHLVGVELVEDLLCDAALAGVAAQHHD